MANDPHAPLRRDIRELGAMLGQVLERHGGAELFAAVEQVRRLSKEGREGNRESAATLAQRPSALPSEAALQLARAAARPDQRMLGHVGHPVDLEQVEAQGRAVDEGEAEVGQAVEADAIPALVGEIAHVEIAAEIREHVDLLELQRHRSADGISDGRVEGLELRRPARCPRNQKWLHREKARVFG